jgi:hypothetical protein
MAACSKQQAQHTLSNVNQIERRQKLTAKLLINIPNAKCRTDDALLCGEALPT